MDNIFLCFLIGFTLAIDVVSISKLKNLNQKPGWLRNYQKLDFDDVNKNMNRWKEEMNSLVPLPKDNTDVDDEIGPRHAPMPEILATTDRVKARCQHQNEKKRLAVLIIARLEEFQQRKWLREYLKRTGIAGPDSRVDIFFILGKPEFVYKLPVTNSGKYYSWKELLTSHDKFNRTILDIHNEDQKYHDIIFSMNFVDSYDNLASKTLIGLHILSKYCVDKYDFIAKADIDTPVNYWLLLEILDELMNSPEKDNLHGKAMYRSKVVKDPDYKYYETDLPYDFFYPYVGGPFYFSSSKSMKIMTAVQSSFNHRCEDAMMGFLAYIAGVKLTHNEKIIFDIPSDTVDSLDNEYECKDLLAIHRSSGKWERITGTYEWYARHCPEQGFIL